MKEVGKIYVEYDYSRFSYFPTNREIGENKKMIKRIKEFDVTSCAPILVDRQYRIMDGQHRFDACKRLGKPIYYIFYDGEYDPETVMIELNTCLKPWRQEEWVQYYYKKGHPDYVAFVEMGKKYDLGISNNILLFSGAKCNASDVKKGKLKDHSEHWRGIYQLVTSIEYPSKLYRPFIAALLRFFMEYGGNERKIERLRQRIICVPRFSRMEDYYQSFKNLTDRKGGEK